MSGSKTTPKGLQGAAAAGGTLRRWGLKEGFRSLEGS